MPTNDEQRDMLHLLHGITFPASRSQIIGAAKDTGGLNGEVILILEQLSEIMYATPQDLTEEIQRIHAAESGSCDVQPAAPTDISNANKELISTMADPRGAAITPAKPSDART